MFTEHTHLLSRCVLAKTLINMIQPDLQKPSNSSEQNVVLALQESPQPSPHKDGKTSARRALVCMF